MSKFELGDRFIAEITNVEDSGMGVVYTLNERMLVSDRELSAMVIFTPVEEVQPVEKVKESHTLDDLRDRVFMLSKLLANAIESYEKVKTELNGTVSYIDNIVNDMGGET